MKSLLETGAALEGAPPDRRRRGRSTPATMPRARCTGASPSTPTTRTWELLGRARAARPTRSTTCSGGPTPRRTTGAGRPAAARRTRRGQPGSCRTPMPCSATATLALHHADRAMALTTGRRPRRLRPRLRPRGPGPGPRLPRPPRRGGRRARRRPRRPRSPTPTTAPSSSPTSPPSPWYGLPTPTPTPRLTPARVLRASECFVRGATRAECSDAAKHSDGADLGTVGAMSVKVELGELAATLADFDVAYLVTVSDEARSHVLSVWPERHRRRASSSTASAATRRPTPPPTPTSRSCSRPPTPGGYTLLVDGTATVDGSTVTIVAGEGDPAPPGRRRRRAPRRQRLRRRRASAARPT